MPYTDTVNLKKRVRSQRPATSHTCRPNECGFTLVEVVIAAVILFSVLALGTLAYRTAIRSVGRVTANVRIADALPAIMAEVRTEVQKRKTKGEGRYGKSIGYVWNAKEMRTSRNTLRSYDETTGAPRYGRFTLALDNVRLTITYEGERRLKESQYEYQELTWSR